MTTQNERLLSYLKTHRRGITQLEAFVELGICRLSERCRELEGLDSRRFNKNWTKLETGTFYAISKKRVKVPTRDGKNATVTRYSLTERT